MTRSAYEAGRFAHFVRVAAVAVVLLLLVAAIGICLMTGGIGFNVVLAVAVTDTVAYIAWKTARGSQRRARARAASVTRSAPPTAVRPVQEGSIYRDGLRGIRLPFDEAVGLGVIDL